MLSKKIRGFERTGEPSDPCDRQTFAEGGLPSFNDFPRYLIGSKSFSSVVEGKNE